MRNPKEKHGTCCMHMHAEGEMNRPPAYVEGKRSMQLQIKWWVLRPKRLPRAHDDPPNRLPSRAPLPLPPLTVHVHYITAGSTSIYLPLWIPSTPTNLPPSPISCQPQPWRRPSSAVSCPIGSSGRRPMVTSAASRVRCRLRVRARPAGRVLLILCSANWTS
jgi:hypothetical protein